MCANTHINNDIQYVYSTSGGGYCAYCVTGDTLARTAEEWDEAGGYEVVPDEHDYIICENCGAYREPVA